MARDFEETTTPLHVGPTDCVILSAGLTLDDRLIIGGGFGPSPMVTQLVSFVSDPDAAQRLRAMASLIARGVQRVTTHSHIAWAAEVNRSAAREPFPQTSIVVVASGARRKVFDPPPMAFDLPEVCPVILVTDAPDLFQDLWHFKFDGIVKPATDDLLGTAMEVFRMMVGTMAPQTYACTDVEDILQVFAGGPCAQISHAAWSPATGLVFASPRDQGLLECARGVLVQLELADFSLLQNPKAIVNELSHRTGTGVPVILVAPQNMFVSAGERSGFRRIAILCMGSN